MTGVQETAGELDAVSKVKLCRRSQQEDRLRFVSVMVFIDHHKAKLLSRLVGNHGRVKIGKRLLSV